MAGRRRPSRARGAGPDGPAPRGPGDSVPSPADEDADPEQVARTICLRQLTLGPRTRSQLAAALAARDVPETAAERVLDRLTEVGLVDDAAYAEAWVRSRSTGRGLARRALGHELRHRGVDDDTVAEALGTLAPETELATARALVERRLAATRGLDPAKRTSRLVGMLARKGYPAGTAYQVVRSALEAEGIDAGGLDEAAPPD